jgi:hypothetical protein
MGVMPTGTFGTAINCIDGRAQAPVADWVKIHYHVDYVDMITEPGVEGPLARGDATVTEAIKRKVMVSATAHSSGVVAVAAHHGCAGNPVSKEEHIAQVRTAMQVVASWGLPVSIAGLWVNEYGVVEVVDTINRPQG